MLDTTWGFAGVAVNGECVDGVYPIHEIRGMEGFKYLQEAYSKNERAFVRIICSTTSGQETYFDSEKLCYAHLSDDGIPIISFLCPERFEPFRLVGWGVSEKDDEFVVDHYEFEGDIFHNQEIANALALSENLFSIYDKDGNCIRADEIRTINFPHDEWSRGRGSPFPPRRIRTTYQYVITLSGKKINIVNNN